MNTSSELCSQEYVGDLSNVVSSRRVLQISSGVENSDGLVMHLVIALAVAWLICFLVLSKGVQSLGKVGQLSCMTASSYSQLHFRVPILRHFSPM
jgi:hypothetical protein